MDKAAILLISVKNSKKPCQDWSSWDGAAAPAPAGIPGLKPKQVISNPYNASCEKLAFPMFLLLLRKVQAEVDWLTQASLHLHPFLRDLLPRMKNDSRTEFSMLCSMCNLDPENRAEDVTGRA